MPRCNHCGKHMPLDTLNEGSFTDKGQAACSERCFEFLAEDSQLREVQGVYRPMSDYFKRGED